MLEAFLKFPLVYALLGPGSAGPGTETLRIYFFQCHQTMPISPKSLLRFGGYKIPEVINDQWISIWLFYLRFFKISDKIEILKISRRGRSRK